MRLGAARRGEARRYPVTYLLICSLAPSSCPVRPQMLRAAALPGEETAVRTPPPRQATGPRPPGWGRWEELGRPPRPHQGPRGGFGDIRSSPLGHSATGPPRPDRRPLPMPSRRLHHLQSQVTTQCHLPVATRRAAERRGALLCALLRGVAGKSL